MIKLNSRLKKFFFDIERGILRLKRGKDVLFVIRNELMFNCALPIYKILEKERRILFFLFVGLEEISWGQRILGVETPNFFSDNVQSETNVHNLEYVNQLWSISFIVLGIVGGFSWLIFPARKNFSYNLFVKFC